MHPDPGPVMQELLEKAKVISNSSSAPPGEGFHPSLCSPSKNKKSQNL